MAARGFLGSGDLYIERYVGGVSQGLQGPYEATKFEIKPNVEKKELVSKGRNTRGQVIESVSVQQPAEFTVELAEVNRESLTIALLGTASAVTQTSGTLTAVDMTAKLDSWVQLTKGKLTGTMTLTNAAASTTYVENTDYVVNRELGWVKALSTGAITDTQALKVTSTYGAIAGSKISGATNVDIRARFILDGINAADKLPCVVTVHEGVIAADAAFDFLSDDFATVTMPGSMKTPAGKSEPFTVELRNS